MLERESERNIQIEGVLYNWSKGLYVKEKGVNYDTYWSICRPSRVTHCITFSRRRSRNHGTPFRAIHRDRWEKSSHWNCNWEGIVATMSQRDWMSTS